jgi:hypothetical protein
MIEAIFFISSEDGFSRWRANGIVARTKAELAQALGVEEDELQPRPDPVQYEQEQKHLHCRQRARSSDWNTWTGRKD